MGKVSRNGFWLITFCSCLLFIVVSHAAGADDNDPNDPNDPNGPNGPRAVLSNKWDAVISILRNKDIEQEVKEKQIDKIVTPIFDFPLMAKLSLGRNHYQ